MPRLALLPALAAVLLAGCDGPVAPERTNPYDPEFDGPRRASAPDSLVVVESGPTAVTVGWADPSSFETGFEVLVGAHPYDVDAFGTERLPENATRYTLDGLVTTALRVVRVRTFGDGGRPSSLSRPLVLRYPAPDSTTVVRGRDGTISADATLFYREPRPEDGTVVLVSTLTFPASGFERFLGEVPGYDRVVGRVGMRDMMVEDVGDGQTARSYALLRGADVLAAGTAVSPGGPFTSGAVVAGDGSLMAALYEPPSAEPRVVVWDVATGARRADATVPMDAVLHMVTRDGTVVLAVDDAVVVGLDPATGAERWRHTGSTRGAPADPADDRIAVVQGTEVVVLDADTGSIQHVVRLPWAASVTGLEGDVLVTGGVTAWDLRTGERLRTFGVGGAILDVAVVGDDLTALTATGGVATGLRRPLRADWVRDRAAEAALRR